MEPPPCIQNAMMTKDKKPFTYTPGGLNLNEIKSPRMARRIERNAAYEGVGSTPAQQNRPQVAPACLPPSAIAAMQPQMHVQVFPSGPPPPPPMNMSRGSAPPPPPPISNIPPPPPPPTQPLPTQKVRTADQQIVERPDMTKIIPENPMGLLKKTVGPKIRNTLLEELYRNPEKPLPQQVPMAKNVYQNAPQSPKSQQIPSPPVENVPYQKDVMQTTPMSDSSRQAWSPPIIERKESTSRNTNQQPERNVNVGCIYIPPINAQQNRNITSPTQSVSSPKVQSPGTPTLKEAPKPWQQKQPVKQEETPQWTRREASISPSANLHDQVNPQSASIQQQQRPTWPQPTQNVQQHRFQDPRPQQTPQKQPVHSGPMEPTYQEARTSQQHNAGQFEPRGVYTEKVLQPQFDPSSHPNAVFVTQPIVLQHPGANYGPPVINRRENVNVKQEIGVRTIPVQIEGRETPNINRNLSRQQSWSNNPTQSGSFKVIQKITGTDGEEEDNRVTEHLPRYPQQFSPEQMRKMQLNDSDQELLNRFRQDVDSEKYPHGESTEPRYKGATIPSKTFKLLQNRTNEPNQNENVPNEEGDKKPQIRNIPIRIEGDNVPRSRTYVPPSQQVPAEEPKKYTGGSIPSRSFRMLQAMTAPDSCANVKEANETNEHYDFPCQGNNWGFSPAYPMYNPQPFWPPYYPPNPYKLPSTEHSNSDPELNRATANKTPGPYFGYPAYTPTRELEQKPISRTPSSFSRCSSSTELENINWRKTPIPYPMYSSPTTPVPNGKTPKSNTCDTESGFKTPVPFWYGYSPTDGQEKSESKPGNNYNYYPPYPPPYYDPYYYPYYYYGYPPMFSPLPYMIPANDQDDFNGYSSMDEMAFYDQKTKEPNTKKKSQCEPHMSPETLVTPTPDNIKEPQKDLSSSESDTETETNEMIQEQVANSSKLQTIRSVTDINVYQQSDDESEVSEVEEDTDVSSNSSVYEEEREEETVPHQLSVIFEVSEVTDTSRQARESSVFSDCTTVEGIRSDDEEVDDITSKQWISDNLAEIASRIQSRINARIELDESEVYSSFTMKTPSPRRETVSTIKEENILNKEVKVIESEKDQETPTALQEKTVSIGNMENCGNIPEVSQIEEAIIPINQQQTSDIVGTTDTYKIQSTETEEVMSKESSDSEDWWGVIGKNEDEYPIKKSSTYNRESEAVQIEIESDGDAKSKVTQEPKCISEESEESKQNGILYGSIPKEGDEIENGAQKEMEVEKEKNLQQNSCKDDVFNEEYEETIPKLEITSAHSSRSSASSRKISSDSDDSSDSENSDSSEDNVDGNQNYENNNIEEETIVIPSIKDRIRALQECISVKKKPTRMDEEIRVNVKSQVESIDNGEPIKSKPISAKSSVKSFDEISEEDSGVTDLSKQYSDNEEFPELRKMSKYQRASTHSRLFQLLQEECENEGEEEEVKDIETRKTQLSLPLTSDMNDKLAEELVHSMLRQKKGQIFRNMSVDKLHAAARKVLQEDGESFDTPSEGFSDYLSPLRNDTGNSTPQEFFGHYNEYMQYYDSWAQAAVNQENEILKSRTHKVVQDVGQNPNSFPVSSAKCPRVLSGKTVHSDLKNLTESVEEISSLKNPDPKS